MSIVFRRSIMGLGIGAAVLLTAAVLFAEIRWDLQPAGTDAYSWTLTQHWRFNYTGLGTQAMDHANCNNNPSTCTYHPIGGDGGYSNTFWGTSGTSGAAAECLEVTTWPGTVTTNPDTVIEVLDPASNTWKYISDDYNDTYQSHARIWIEGTGTGSSQLRIRPYSTADNADDFKVTITRRADLNNNISCTSGQTDIPWVQISQLTPPTVVVTVSSFH